MKELTYNGNNVFKINFGLYGYDCLDFEKTEESIKNEFEIQYKEQLIKTLQDIGLEFIRLEYYNPLYYNYETDSLDLVIKIKDKSKLKKAIQEHKIQIQSNLDNNKSRDGYIPLTIDTVEEELNNLENKDYELDVLVLSTLIRELIKFDFEIHNYFVFDEEITED